MLYLAIDQHRKQLTVNLRNEAGDVVLKRQVSTQWKLVREFFAELQERSRAEGGYVAIVEVCGFNDWLLKLLGEYGCRETILIQPEKRSKKKTDYRDANALGELLWVNRARLLAGKKVQGVRRVQPPSPQVAADRQLTRVRQRLGQSRTRTINQIKQILRKHNIEQECPTKGLDTLKGRAWLTRVTLTPIDRLALDQLLAQWKLWDEQIDKVQDAMTERYLANPTAVLLATIPGCGVYSSLVLASRIGDIVRFPRPDSLANYWGLTPRSRNSGEATDRLGSITKQGSAPARFILGQLVQHVLRRDPAMKAWYLPIKRRRGSKIARVAVMRRLATILYQMVRRQEPYEIGRPSRAAAKASAGQRRAPDAAGNVNVNTVQKNPDDAVAGTPPTPAPASGDMKRPAAAPPNQVSKARAAAVGQPRATNQPPSPRDAAARPSDAKTLTMPRRPRGVAKEDFRRHGKVSTGKQNGRERKASARGRRACGAP
jgi:transposase